MTETTIRIAIAVTSFLIGVFVGFVIWHKSKDNKTLTALQIVSMGMFFAYLTLTAVADVQYSDFVAITILAITGGEPIGKALAKYTESKK